MKERDGITYYEGVPTDLHPEGLRGKGPAVEMARGGLEAVYTTIGTVLDTEKALKGQPDAGPKLFDAAYPALERAVQHAGKAIDTIDGTIKATEAEVAAKLAFKGKPVLGQEIRGHFAKQKAPFTALLGLARAGDIQAAQAVLDGPAYLAGLTPDQAAELRNAIAIIAAPAAVAALDDARKARARVAHGLEYLTTFAMKKKASWVNSTADLEKLRNMK